MVHVSLLPFVSDVLGVPPLMSLQTRTLKTKFDLSAPASGVAPPVPRADPGYFAGNIIPGPIYSVINLEDAVTRQETLSRAETRFMKGNEQRL